MSSLKKGFGARAPLKPNKRVKSSASLLNKNKMTLQSVSNASEKLQFDLYKEE